MKSINLVVILSSFIISYSYAQNQEELFQRFIKTLNNNQEKEYKEFIENYVSANLLQFSPDKLFQQIHDELGTIEFVKKDFESSKKIAITVDSKIGKVGFIMATREEEGNLRIAGYSYTTIGNYKTFDTESFKAFVSETLGDPKIENAFSGNILIKQNDEILFQESMGYANKELQVSNKKETKFLIGSVSKVFTSMAIYKLAEDQKLNLDDKISKHIPELEEININSEVTILDLLKHESGLSDILFSNEAQLTSKWNFNSYNDLLPLIYEQGSSHEYGSFNYSNSGYLLLGKIIENASGMSYNEFVRENIFDKLEMNSTHEKNYPQLIDNAATGYTKITGEVKDGLIEYDRDADSGWDRYSKFDYGFSTPAGGHYSTQEDLLKVLQGLRKETIITTPSLNESMKTLYNYFDTYQYGNAKAYGAGVTIREVGKYLAIGHGGTTPGWSCEMYFFESLGLDIIILSNHDRMEGAQLLLNNLLKYFRQDNE